MGAAVTKVVVKPITDAVIEGLENVILTLSAGATYSVVKEFAMP
jgi:hypothetical protein